MFFCKHIYFSVFPIGCFLSFSDVSMYDTLDVYPLQRPVRTEQIAIVHVGNGLNSRILSDQADGTNNGRGSVDL